MSIRATTLAAVALLVLNLSRALAGDAPPATAARLKALLAGHHALAAARDDELSRVLDSLAKAGIALPRTHFDGKQIRVVGTLSLFAGRPQIPLE